MERSELLYLGVARVWRELKPEELPSEADVTEFIKKAEVSLGELVENLPQRRAETIAELRELREIKVQAQDIHSRPSLCADLLHAAVSVPILEEAVDELEHGHKQDFAMLFYLTTGFGEPLDAITAAEETIRGNDFAESVSTLGSTLGNDIATQVETYQTTHAHVRELVDLLKADPSGFTLLDRNLQDLQTQTYLRANKQIVLIGAKYCVELYKGIYPLSEPVHLL